MMDNAQLHRIGASLDLIASELVRMNAMLGAVLGDRSAELADKLDAEMPGADPEPIKVLIDPDLAEPERPARICEHMAKPIEIGKFIPANRRIDLRTAPSGMETLAATWRGR